MYNDFQFKTETKFNQKNELITLGIGAYDVNTLNKRMKDPDDDQRYMLNYLPESVQWSYTLGITYKHYGNRWNHLSYSVAVPYKTRSRNTPTTTKAKRNWWIKFRRNGE